MHTRVISSSSYESLQSKYGEVGNGKHSDLIAIDGAISCNLKKYPMLFPTHDDDYSLKKT